jgi:hypothetical protein
MLDLVVRSPLRWRDILDLLRSAADEWERNLARARWRPAKIAAAAYVVLVAVWGLTGVAANLFAMTMPGPRWGLWSGLWLPRGNPCHRRCLHDALLFDRPDGQSPGAHALESGAEPGLGACSSVYGRRQSGHVGRVDAVPDGMVRRLALRHSRRTLLGNDSAAVGAGLRECRRCSRQRVGKRSERGSCDERTAEMKRKQSESLELGRFSEPALMILISLADGPEARLRHDRRHRGADGHASRPRHSVGRDHAARGARTDRTGRCRRSAEPVPIDGTWAVEPARTTLGAGDGRACRKTPTGARLTESPDIRGRRRSPRRCAPSSMTASACESGRAAPMCIIHEGSVRQSMLTHMG